MQLQYSPVHLAIMHYSKTLLLLLVTQASIGQMFAVESVTIYSSVCILLGIHLPTLFSALIERSSV